MELVSMPVQQHFEKVPLQNGPRPPKLIVERLAVDSPRQSTAILAHMSAFLKYLASTEQGIASRSVFENVTPIERMRFEVFNPRSIANKQAWAGGISIAGYMGTILAEVPSLSEPVHVRANQVDVHTNQRDESYISLLFDADSEVALLEEQDKVYEVVSDLAGVRVKRYPDVVTDMRLVYAEREASPDVIADIEKTVSMVLPLNYTFAPVQVSKTAPTF